MRARGIPCVRPNAFYERLFEGEVTLIDRNVTIKIGRVVKVIAKIDNPEGDLRIGMTGYAKIGSGTMPVWKRSRWRWSASSTCRCVLGSG